MGCGASSDAKEHPPQDAKASKGAAGVGGVAGDAEAGSTPAALTIRQPREESYRQKEGEMGVATPAVTPGAASGQQGNKHFDAALGVAGKVIGTGKSVTDGAASALGGTLGAVADANPDGTFTLKTSLGPLPLDDPRLKAIAPRVLFAASVGLQASQGGLLLFKSLDAIFTLYMAHHTKPTWLAEFMLYLAGIESEVLAGQAAFRRQGFLLLLAHELEQVRANIAFIASRSTLKSLLFSSSDQETLAASRLAIEKLKASALQGMLVDIGSEQAALTGGLEALVADLKKRQKAGWNLASDARVDAARTSLTALQQLPRLLKPQYFEADVLRRNADFFPGTRAELLADFARWATLEPPTLRGNEQSPPPASSRVFLVTGGPGDGLATWAGHVAGGIL